MLVYHPYFGTGLYSFCAFKATGVNLTAPILEQKNNTISLSLSGRKLKITSERESCFLVIKSLFY